MIPRVLILLPLLNFFLSAQILSRKNAEHFVHDLIWNPDSIQSWFDENSLSTAHRLGIEYQGMACKNLISYDLEDSLKQLIKQKRLQYSIILETPVQGYTHLVLRFDRYSLSRDFYFLNQQVVSPFAYFSRHWWTRESKYFRFILSDTTLFNSYCIRQLELFVSDMATRLGFEQPEIQTLQENKIFYFLCRDEDEIERITGFRTRGMYSLAYDAIITTYNAHYHELLHLLINFKLHHLSLYSHPFLQEGLAVAYGGRGGLNWRVALPMGRFLINSQFVDATTLLNCQDFLQLDASLSYPVAGLYTRFLMDTMGSDFYLELYREHNGTADDPAVRQILPAELPANSIFRSYLSYSSKQEVISLELPSPQSRIITENDSVNVFQDDHKYYFLLQDYFVLGEDKHFPGYASKKFNEILPHQAYQGEKYLINVRADEISVYNLFTNELIASYIASFVLPPVPVPKQEGRYYFSIDKTVFEEPLEMLK
jgi:hypothetical protein